ncbi:MAG: ABC transporter substrate-binding protein, partial [Nanoarchaeota archaeon]
MKGKKSLLILIILVLGLFLLYGCGGITGKATAVGAQPKIKIGALMPLSGDAAAYGENVKQGIELALQGTNFEVFYEDSKCDGPDAVNAVRKLIDVDGVVAVIGELCSGATLSASPIAKEAGVVLISPASTSPDLSNAGDHFFRTVPSDALQGVEAAKLVKRLGYNSLAVLYVNDDYGVGFDKVLRENFDNVVISESFEKESNDLRTQLTKIKEKNPEAIYIISNSPSSAGVALKQIKELGITSQVFGSEGLKDESVLDAAEGAGEGILLTFIAPSNTLIGRQFANEFKETYNIEPPIFAAEAYDAVLALNEAVLNSDGSRQGIMNAM